MTDAATRRPPAPLIGVAACAAAIAILLTLERGLVRSPFGWDAAILQAVRAWGGPGWLSAAAIDVTALGGGTVLTIVVTIATGFLLLTRHRGTALALVSASVSGNAVVDLTKSWVARPRPDIVPHLVPVHNLSFPSGHSASSAIIYLTLAALAAQLTADRAVRRYLTIVAVALTGIVGASRVYLGVHWPSDVIAGWCFGIVWAIGWWWATAAARRSLRREGIVSPDR